MDKLWDIIQAEISKRGGIKTKEDQAALERFSKTLNKLECDNPNLANFLSNNNESRRKIFSDKMELIDIHNSLVHNQFLKFDIVAFVDSLIEVQESEKSILIDEILKQRNLDLSFTEIKSNLKESIKNISDERSEIYARILSNLPTKYSMQLSYDRYKDRITHVGVSGTLIKTSAPQCILAVKSSGFDMAANFETLTPAQKSNLDAYKDRGYNKRVPIDKFINEILPLAKDNGLIEGTTIDNVWTNALHWGCRHSFTPLIIR